MNLSETEPPSVKDQFVVFLLDEQRYALHLEVVERVFPVTEITALPRTPDIVLGVINLQAKIVPVFNVRGRFRIPEREPQLSDHLLVARAAQRSVALLVDAVEEVIECSKEEIVGMGSVVPDEYVEGVVKFSDGLVLIHDLDSFLSLEEATELNQAIEEAELET